MSMFANLLNRFRGRRVDVDRDDPAASRPLAEVEFLIPNMVCEGCAGKIAAALNSVSGVREIRSKVPQKRILVHYTPAEVDAAQLKDALSKVGFTAVDA